MTKSGFENLKSVHRTLIFGVLGAASSFMIVMAIGGDFAWPITWTSIWLIPCLATGIWIRLVKNKLT